MVEAVQVTEPEVEVSILKHGQLFQHARELTKAEQQSQQLWVSMDSDERVVLCQMVRELLLRFAENPDTWLPGSLEPTESDWIKFGLRFQLGWFTGRNYEENVQHRRDLREAGEDLLLLEADLRSSPT